MRLSHIFNFVIGRLTTVDGLKLTTWWNNQGTDGTIHTAPAVFIEFPEPLPVETLNGQLQQAAFKIRVHLYTKLHANKDGGVSTNRVTQHENIVNYIYDSLQEWDLKDRGEIILSSLERTRLDFNMSEPGWAITVQDFECMIYQQPVTLPYTLLPLPPLEVESWP